MSRYNDGEALRPDVIAGRNPVLELLKGPRAADTVFVAQEGGSIAQIIALAARRGIPVKRVSPARLEAMTGGCVHQGVAATLPAHAYAQLEDILAAAGDEPPFIVVADGIEDPHNLGAVIRTAEAAGAHGLVIPKRRAAPLTPAVAKAAAGALEHLPVAREANLVRVLEDLKKRGVWTYAADMSGQDYASVRFDGPAALVIGAEGGGVGRLVRETCDFTVSLPMYGKISSLNASVAAGILLYEIARQRHGAPKQ